MKDQRTAELDVRRLPPWERHPKIFGAFVGLQVGGELRVISDHEPRPLREEFERTHPRCYVWMQRMLGADRWEVLLRRVAAPQTAGMRDFLRRCAIFADVSRETLDRLDAAATEKWFHHNEAITEQDVDWGGFGVVVDGTLAAVIGSALGREHALFEILAGDAFGEIATIDGGFTPARFVVMSESARVVCIPKAVMRAALGSDRGLANAMNDLCAQHMRIIIERFAAQTALSTVARVAAALLPHAAPQPGLGPVLSSFQMTQGELATIAGTVKEVVSRALAQLEEGRAIERSGGHIVKVDREKLSAYASSL
jgi:uncharacterized protein (DUF2249 family)